jgi:hypothetical protein
MAPTARVPCPNCCLSADLWMIEEGGLRSASEQFADLVAEDQRRQRSEQRDRPDQRHQPSSIQALSAARRSVVRGSATAGTSPSRVTCSLSASSTAWNCTCATLANIRMYSTSRTEAS